MGDLIGVGEVLPASAWRRKIRHQPSCRFSQQAPLGMKAWRMRGMAFQPGPGALAVVAGEVVGDHVDRAVGVGLLLQLEEVLVCGAVADGAHMVIAPIFGTVRRSCLRRSPATRSATRPPAGPHSTGPPTSPS